MTARKRAMHYAGDRRSAFHVGQAMGPGVDGFYRRVTEVTFDGRRNRTLVALEVQEIAPEGKRLRYFGGADEDTAEPDVGPVLADSDNVTPR